MDNTTNSTDVAAIEPGGRARSAIGLAMEDARLGLRYHLLRLSLLGLTNQDQKRLRELARLIFSEADVSEIAARIARRKTASPMSVAMSDLIASAPDKRIALLGAIFGAYAGLSSAGGPNVSDAIVGAIAGGAAISTNDFVIRHLDLKRFLAAD